MPSSCWMVTLHVHGCGYREYESTRTPVRATGAGMVLIDADGAADVCAVGRSRIHGGILRCARGEAILLVVVPVPTLRAVSPVHRRGAVMSEANPTLAIASPVAAHQTLLRFFISIVSLRSDRRLPVSISSAELEPLMSK